jgi:hypothetical protein
MEKRSLLSRCPSYYTNALKTTENSAQLDPRKANSETPSKKTPRHEWKVCWLPYFRRSTHHPTTYIQSTYPYTTSLKVPSPLLLDLPGVILPPVKMLRLCHPLLLNQRDNSWWGAQIIKILTTNFSTPLLILLSKTCTFSSAFCYITVSRNELRVPLLVRRPLFTGTRP